MGNTFEAETGEIMLSGSRQQVQVSQTMLAGVTDGLPDKQGGETL